MNESFTSLQRMYLGLINPIVYNQTGKHMAQAESNTILDLDNLDDLSLNDVEAAPEFIEPPHGRYKLDVQVKIESYQKDEVVNKEKTGEKVDAKRIRFTYSIAEVIELKDKKELVPATGSMFSETFSATAEGLPYFKTRAKAILGELGESTIKEVINELNSLASPFTADVKTRSTKDKDKDGNERVYTNVNVRVIEGAQTANLS